MEGRQHRRLRRYQLSSLGGSGALPDAQCPGRFAPESRSQGNRRVYQNGSFERTSNALQDGDLRSKRYGKHHDRRLRTGLDVLEAADKNLLRLTQPGRIQCLFQTLGRIFGLGLIARPDQHQGQRRSEEHTSELQSRLHLVCRLLLEKKKQITWESTQT